jgi:hypothetical protein
MRTKLFAIIRLSFVGAIALGSPPAAAAESRRRIRIPGDCSYRSYAECRASASGRIVSCNRNPRFVYAQPRGMRIHRDY